MLGSPWLPRALNVRLDTASDPGEYPSRSPERDTDCCLPEGQTRRHSRQILFGAQHLQGRLHPLPLHLACFRTYASTCPLPSTPQGSILGSRRTITQAGFPPASSRGLARPHYPDYLARLNDARLLVLEYKGSFIETHDQRKRQIGLAWQRAMKGQGVFLWIGDSSETARGRTIAQQIQDGLRGIGAVRGGARR